MILLSNFCGQTWISVLWVKNIKCWNSSYSPVGLSKGRSLSAHHQVMRSDFLQWIEETRGQYGFSQNQCIKQTAYSFLPQYLTIYIFDCRRAVLSSESVLVCVLFLHFWSHTNITVEFLFFCFPPFIQHCCHLWFSINMTLKQVSQEKRQVCHVT